MQKLNCLLMNLVLSLSIISSVNAQSNMADIAFGNPGATGKRITAPNQKADMHFRRSFKVLSETWREKADGYRATFTHHKARYMVDYDKKGNWVSTIKSFDGTLLSPAIAESVMAAFLGFMIVHVTEVEMGDKCVRLIKIENRNSLKTVRVSDGEMDVIESYRRE
jgi:hypothetical protein